MGDRDVPITPGGPVETSEARVLSDLPPDNWFEARRRHALLVEYMRINRPTTDDADRYARKLDVSTRQLQRLVKTYRLYQAGRSTGGSRRGRRSAIPPQVTKIVDDVARDLGSSATDVEVQAEAELRSLAANLPVASLNAVRTRRGRTPQPVNLSQRLGVEFDLIVDCCAFTFDVVEGESTAPAVFCAILAGDDGKLIAWSLLTGLPSAADLMSLVRQTAELSGDAGGRAPLKVAAPIHESNALADFEDELAALGFTLAKQTSIRMRRGAAIVPSLGLRIGRMPFSPLRKPDATPAAVIPIELAHEVIAQTLGQSKACATKSHSSSSIAAGAPPPAHLRAGEADDSGAPSMHGAIMDIVARCAEVDHALAFRTADAICREFGPLVRAALEAKRLLEEASAPSPFAQHFASGQRADHR